MRYYARISIRDGEKTIADCLFSLMNQTIQPEKIIVVDDGSTDDTALILEGLSTEFLELIQVINTGSKTRDYTRLAYLLNISLKREYDFMLTTGGDCSFTPDYAEKLLHAFRDDPELVIASGIYSHNTKSPTGAGRMIRMSWFNEHYPKGFPEKIGYESEILERALYTGKKNTVVKDARFEHLDKLGHSHGFKEWGWSMRALGYHPAFVLGRAYVDMIKYNHISKKGVLSMVYHYLTYRPNGGYYGMHDAELRTHVRNRQKTMIKKMIKNKLAL